MTRVWNRYTLAEELSLAMPSQWVQAGGFPGHLGSNEPLSLQIGLLGVTGASQIIRHTSDFITPVLEPFPAVHDYSYSG